MKLPGVNYSHFSNHIKLWEETARQLSLEHGVYIEVAYEFEIEPVPKLSDKLTRIYFKALGHEFDSKRALMKGLKNKAFA